jgi:hypothetical protein
MKVIPMLHLTVHEMMICSVTVPFRESKALQDRMHVENILH